MALAEAIKGATRPSQVITWTRGEGVPEDLTGATLTGKIKARDGTLRNIAGTLTVTDGTNGIFLWSYDAADVASDGWFVVQFTALFGASPTLAKTHKSSWRVYEAL